MGSFPSLEEAEEHIADLTEKGIEAYYVVALINNKIGIVFVLEATTVAPSLKNQCLC